MIPDSAGHRCERSEFYDFTGSHRSRFLFHPINCEVLPDRVSAHFRIHEDASCFGFGWNSPTHCCFS